MNEVSKAALKRFLHQHIDDMVDHFADHLLMPEAILTLSLSNHCSREEDDGVTVDEEIVCNIVPFNDPTDSYGMEDVFTHRRIYKGAKTIESTSTEIMGGGLV